MTNDPFTSSDWKRLRALRDRFLSDATREYWTPGDLELYDATFAQRIGWKWDGVLRSLDRAGWKPTSKRLIDWGCGTGIAALAVAEWSGIKEVLVHDQSPLAMKFSIDKCRSQGLESGPLRPGDTIPEDSLLLVSHVAGELLEDELTSLANYAAGASEIIWVEPGSREISLRLSKVHGVLREGGHRLIAPCTHNEVCPMSTQEKDWCHFFARPPSDIFQSAFWREFSLKLEIDLRALPFSFLVSAKNASPRWPQDAERLIGRPRVLKGHCELHCCGAGGLVVRGLQKRDEPELFRRLCREDLDGVFQWQINPDRPQRVSKGRLLDEA
ncbi:MAG: small ribosomal subunit Rsm22 family protein [Terrimicrobiaceae bacterium]